MTTEPVLKTAPSKKLKKNKRRGPKVSKDIIPEEFEKHYHTITKEHSRFKLKQVYLEYVDACGVAFEEVVKKEYKTDMAKKKPQKYKNRFRYILPYEETRVILEPLPGMTLEQQKLIPGDDYINASWITGMDGEKKAYISTQGPKIDKDDDDNVVNTIPDFWRMVWDSHVGVIVMLTRIKEDDEFEIEKCTKYWPENLKETMDMPEAQLALTYDTEVEDVKYDIWVRSFTLSRNGEQSREVKQVQYRGWPDHSVPEVPEAFISMCDKVDEINGHSPVPLVVHCSAGVGRSGTFIAIHSYVRHLRKVWDGTGDLPDLNIPKLLISLRNDRPKMVQTKEQYEFIYKAVLLEFERKFTRLIEKIKEGN